LDSKSDLALFFDGKGGLLLLLASWLEEEKGMEVCLSQYRPQHLTTCLPGFCLKAPLIEH
jgi:hypothetical protein